MAIRELVTNRSGTFLKLPRVIRVQPLEDYVVRLTFSDGMEKEVDLEPYLRGPLYAPVRNDPAYFRSVHVDIDTIAWPNGLDIAPETLYYEGNPPWAQGVKQRGRRSESRRRRAIRKSQGRSTRRG